MGSGLGKVCLAAWNIRALMISVGCGADLFHLGSNINGFHLA